EVLLRAGHALAELAARHDHLVGVLLRAASLLTLSGRTTLSGASPLVTARLYALTTSVWVIDRVLGGTTGLRTKTHVASATGLSDRHQTILLVRYFTVRGPSRTDDLANFGRWQADLGVASVLGDYFSVVTGSTSDSGATARLQFHGVHEGTDRDLGKRQAVTDRNASFLGHHEGVTDIHALWHQDVTALTVSIKDEGDETDRKSVV